MKAKKIQNDKKSKDTGKIYVPVAVTNYGNFYAGYLNGEKYNLWQFNLSGVDYWKVKNIGFYNTIETDKYIFESVREIDVD